MTRINLIRESAAQQKRRAHDGPALQWIAVLVAVVALHGAVNVWVESISEARDSLRGSVEEIERAAAQLRESTPRSLATQPARPPSLAGVRLRSIAASMPADLWLVGYREHRGEAAMRGMSLNEETTRAFVDKLSATSVFTYIEIIETTRAGTASPGGEAAPLYEFQLKASLQDDLPGSAIVMSPS